MSNAHQGLYPIIRRVRRPLIVTDAGTAALVVVPAKAPQPPLAPPQVSKTETKRNAAPTKTNE